MAGVGPAAITAYRPRSVDAAMAVQMGTGFRPADKASICVRAEDPYA
jgi:hypothetical protein